MRSDFSKQLNNIVNETPQITAGHYLTRFLRSAEVPTAFGPHTSSRVGMLWKEGVANILLLELFIL